MLKTSQALGFLDPILPLLFTPLGFPALPLSWPPLCPLFPWHWVPRSQSLLSSSIVLPGWYSGFSFLPPCCVTPESLLSPEFFLKLQIHVSKCLPGPGLSLQFNVGSQKQFLNKLKQFISNKCDVSIFTYFTVDIGKLLGIHILYLTARNSVSVLQTS